ncbi:LOW QUALITY PROTEIN: hypothetical protein HID58_014881 [Brassica napus]|uniref:Uncharacterized protein n=1 Tax=Brassica napus TaxID=3708 RepID=A0ABQ8DIG8_BRANA|nr:LOW QUALITY PROTEIN: hypothetical protein HID58_014881 [Brassica napus]
MGSKRSDGGLPQETMPAATTGKSKDKGFFWDLAVWIHILNLQHREISSVLDNLLGLGQSPRMNLIIASAATVHRLHVANAPVILGRSDDSDDDSAGENVRSTCLDSQPSVSVVLLKTKEKIACFTADQPRQQKKHKSQSTVSDANAEFLNKVLRCVKLLKTMQMRFSNVTSISNKDFASRFQLMGMHRHMEQRVDFMDWGPGYVSCSNLIFSLWFSLWFLTYVLAVVNNHGMILTSSIKSIKGLLRNGLEKRSIDFAYFLTYTEPETVVLLLKFSNSGAVLNVTIEKIQGGNDLRSILSKEDSFRSLSSNDELEGYKEDVRAMSVALGVSTDSIGESGGWMVRKGMHTRQFLQQRTDTDDQTETGETCTKPKCNYARYFFKQIISRASDCHDVVRNDLRSSTQLPQTY